MTYPQETHIIKCAATFGGASSLEGIKVERIDLVVKIGSMALIRREDNDIDYNLFSRLSGELRPGMAVVSSGATEISLSPFSVENSERPLRRA